MDDNNKKFIESQQEQINNLKNLHDYLSKMDKYNKIKQFMQTNNRSKEFTTNFENKLENIDFLIENLQTDINNLNDYFTGKTENIISMKDAKIIIGNIVKRNEKIKLFANNLHEAINNFKIDEEQIIESTGGLKKKHKKSRKNKKRRPHKSRRYKIKH